LQIMYEVENRLKIPESALSHIYHLTAFKMQKPGTRFEKGMLIISVDVDVGQAAVGIRNQGKNDARVHHKLSEFTIGKIEENALPFFVNMFETLEVAATFAIRGQCLDINNDAVDLLLDSSIKNDIGSHGYTHRRFGDLSHSDAEMEMSMTGVAMRKCGIIPRSFIFPQDSVGHLDLLEKYGYKSYRSYGGFLQDRMQIEQHGGLYNICPSMHLTRSANALFLKKIVDIAVTKKAPFHVWFHLWNFGENMESIRRNATKTVFPLLLYAREKMNLGVLTFETMLSVTEKIEKSGKNKEIN
jgi:hypothetical protein